MMPVGKRKAGYWSVPPQNIRLPAGGNATVWADARSLISLYIRMTSAGEVSKVSTQRHNPGDTSTHYINRESSFRTTCRFNPNSRNVEEVLATEASVYAGSEAYSTREGLPAETQRR